MFLIWMFLLIKQNKFLRLWVKFWTKQKLDSVISGWMSFQIIPVCTASLKLSSTYLALKKGKEKDFISIPLKPICLVGFAHLVYNYLYFLNVSATRLTSLTFCSKHIWRRLSGRKNPSFSLWVAKVVQAAVSCNLSSTKNTLLIPSGFALPFYSCMTYAMNYSLV